MTPPFPRSLVNDCKFPFFAQSWRFLLLPSLSLVLKCSERRTTLLSNSEKEPLNICCKPEIRSKGRVWGLGFLTDSSPSPCHSQQLDNTEIVYITLLIATIVNQMIRLFTTKVHLRGIFSWKSLQRITIISYSP